MLPLPVHSPAVPQRSPALRQLLQAASPTGASSTCRARVCVRAHVCGCACACALVLVHACLCVCARGMRLFLVRVRVWVSECRVGV